MSHAHANAYCQTIHDLTRQLQTALQIAEYPKNGGNVEAAQKIVQGFSSIYSQVNETYRRLNFSSQTPPLLPSPSSQIPSQSPEDAAIRRAFESAGYANQNTYVDGGAEFVRGGEDEEEEEEEEEEDDASVATSQISLTPSELQRLEEDSSSEEEEEEEEYTQAQKENDAKTQQLAAAMRQSQSLDAQDKMQNDFTASSGPPTKRR